MSSPQVAMVMGSGSDLDVMMNGIKVLKGYGIEYEVRVISAHRAPDAVGEYARAAASRGIKVLIAGAGAAAHLAGALAAHSALPIIGVPLVQRPDRGPHSPGRSPRPCRLGPTPGGADRRWWTDLRQTR